MKNPRLRVEDFFYRQCVNLFAKSLSHFDEISSNRNMLRANFFARAAFYALAGIILAVKFNEPVILISRKFFILVKRQDIVRRERTAYADILRTNFSAIVAGRAPISI